MKSLVIFFLLVSTGLFSQNFQFEENNYIYKLDEKIRKGDFYSFIEIGNYFDSKKKLIEFLGYHNINTNESNVAKRIVHENSFFLPNEIVIDSLTTTNQFKNFLLKNQKKIIFSDLADAFIITPFEERKTKYEILELTESRLKFLNEKSKELFNSEWVNQNDIDKLILEKNPLVLLKLSSILLKERYRFDEYSNNKDQIVNLIQLLTKSHIAVPNETGNLSYHLEEDFYDESKINLLIFFANNYQNYKWDENENAFVNHNLVKVKIEFENNLFDLLLSENDSIALNSFIKLTELNTNKVIDLANQYEKARIKFNYILPTFTYRFLKQLVYLTDFCRKRNVDYIGSKELKNSIEILKTKLTFSERRKLEDKLINTLTLEEITSFEYWSLIYEKDWELTFSSGRILDKFYSKNWNELIQNPKYLEMYLLKSKLFVDLGIVGYCNNYLFKFIGTSNFSATYLKSLNTNEPKVITQIEKALVFSNNQIIFKEKSKKDWYGNIDTNIKSFRASFKKAIEKSKNKEELKENISYLLSQINYNQIGESLNAIKTLDINPNDLFSFINRDFGFSFIGNFEKFEIRKDFLDNYQKLDEQNLYKYYLKKNEIDFADSNDNLDFDKIYEILKFDINNAFSGGGGSTKDNCVYAIIKLLELKFKTTLGYPSKICNSNNMYACNSRDRAIEWMNYLEKNKLLFKEHNEPISFGFEYEE